MALLENRPFDDLAIGDSATLSRTLSPREIKLYAVMSGDINPAHLDPAYAEQTRFEGVVGHGMWLGALVSNLIGTRLPGPGTVYLSQDLHFLAPVKPGDTVEVRVEVAEKQANRQVVLRCECRNQTGLAVAEGSAVVIAPAEKMHREAPELPDIEFRDHAGYDRLIRAAKSYPTLPIALVHPCSAVVLEGALQAAAEDLMRPVLVGPAERIRKIADGAHLDISSLQIIDTAHSHASAERAAALARDGEVATLMKGSLHTDEFLRAVIAREAGLRTDRRMSHIYLVSSPDYPKPLMVTDCAINVAPDLATKVDICQNAIDFAHGLGIGEPKVAILAAVEKVNLHMQATLDAAALCKMADRRQIKGGVLDGPLAFDNAIDPEAARIKGLPDKVAGQPDILLVPDLEAGNILVKQMTFMSDDDAAGLVLGARVPLILTSRADSLRTRLASVALAVVACHMRPRKGDGDH